MSTKWDCLRAGGEWLKKRNTFDNVLYAALSLFQISTTEGWVDMMQAGVDATDVDYVPVVKNNQIM
jgi:hypothetical protein